MGGAIPRAQGHFEDVPSIEAPVLVRHAGLDGRINAGAYAHAEAMAANGKTFTERTCRDVNHGFHNDTTPGYVKDAATLAWHRTLVV